MQAQQVLLQQQQHMQQQQQHNLADYDSSMPLQKRLRLTSDDWNS